MGLKLGKLFKVVENEKAVTPPLSDDDYHSLSYESAASQNLESQDNLHETQILVTKPKDKILARVICFDRIKSYKVQEILQDANYLIQLQQ